MIPKTREIETVIAPVSAWRAKVCPGPRPAADRHAVPEIGVNIATSAHVCTPPAPAVQALPVPVGNPRRGDRRAIKTVQMQGGRRGSSEAWWFPRRRKGDEAQRRRWPVFIARLVLEGEFHSLIVEHHPHVAEERKSQHAVDVDPPRLARGTVQ